jgi:parallel beta-helix repeat protein
MKLANGATRVVGLFTLLVLLLALIPGCSKDDTTSGPPQPQYTILSGDLNTQTLTVSESPYLVVDSIRVPVGQTVTIESGVEIRFDGLYWFKVDGALQAAGTSTDPIVFTSNRSSPDYGDWRNIIFTNPDAQSHMTYCIVAYGALYDTTTTPVPYYNYRGGIAIVNSNPIIDHCVIYNVGYNGIYMADGASPTITNNVIIQNDDNGIYCGEGCFPTIRYNDSWNNHSQDWVGVPEGVGDETQLNVNLDSCDVFFNVSLNPLFLTDGDFHMHSCSPCINAGDPSSAQDLDGTLTDMGVYYYNIDPDNIRKKVEGTLTMAHSPYRVTCDAFVPQGSTLSVDPGVIIRFEGDYDFTVYGSLSVNGNAANRVVITTDQANPPRGYWNDISFVPTSSGNSINYCDIDHGKMVVVDSTDATFDHVVFREMEHYGLYAHNASPVLTNCEFWGAGIACIVFDSLASSDALVSRSIISGAEGRGISVNYYSSPMISNCVIFDNGTSGIQCLWRSDPTIVNNTVTNNGYYGVFCQWNSSPILMNNIFTNNNLHGISCQYSSVPPISYNNVWNNYLMLPDSLSGQRQNYFDCQPGVGDISSNPMFVNPMSEGQTAAPDFRLSSGSPCIDAGNPDPAYNDADGSRNDMGAYGGPGGNW